MFTGIVERTARIARLERRPGGRRITVEVRNEKALPEWVPAAEGESIALSGVCLTVVETKARRGGELVSFEAVPETLERTTLGRLRAGDLVNIERSLKVGDRFGGHYVTGHVDGVGTVRSHRTEGDQVLLWIDAPETLIEQMIPKGSVAVDGISLTLIEVDREASRFSFAAVPYTIARTTLARRTVRSLVNIETDAFGKWVLHATKALGGEEGGKARGGETTKKSMEGRLRQLLETGDRDTSWGHDEV